MDYNVKNMDYLLKGINKLRSLTVLKIDFDFNDLGKNTDILKILGTNLSNLVSLKILSLSLNENYLGKHSENVWYLKAILK